MLWGDQLRIRFLLNIEDPWFSTPEQKFEDITGKTERDWEDVDTYMEREKEFESIKEKIQNLL